MNPANRITAIAIIAVAALVWFGASAAQAEPMKMGLEFEFNRGGGSPELRLSNIPDGTVKLKAEMVDLDYTVYDHGGGTVPYKGKSVIPAYGLNHYDGPNPQEGTTHNYEITVEAIDAGGNVIGVGKSTRQFFN